MHVFEKNIKELGITIPDLPVALANYVPYRIVDNIMYVSGQAPIKDGKMQYIGKVGADISIEDGIRAAGTVEIAGFKKPINQNMIKLIEDTARKILPELGKVKSQWIGFRPTLPDSLPIIGESKKCKNVYYAFGHQHLGLSLAAVTGKALNPTTLP